MMAEIQITCYPDNGAAAMLDLTGVDSITINERFTDISDFTTVGTFTREFRVPDTVKNRSIFGMASDPNIEGIQAFYKKMPAQISVSGVPYKTGYVQLKRAIIKSKTVVDYEIVFYAETPNLAKSLGSKKLADITTLGDQDEVVNFANVTDDKVSRIWALTDRGQKWSEQGEQGTRPVQNINLPVYPGDLTPCLQWKWLFQQIMLDSGFEYNAPNLLDILASYWMPWINASEIGTSDLSGGYLFRADIDSPQVSTGYNVLNPIEIFDNNGDFASGIYTAPFTGYFNFRTWATITPDGSQVSGVIRLVRPSNFEVFWVSSFNTWSSFAPNFQPDIASVFLTQGTEVQLTIQLFSGGTIEAFSGDIATGTGFELTSISGALYGATIGYNRNAPDMRQIDFVNDIVKMHNLAVVPDPQNPNRISFIPMPDYIGSGDTKNWSTKIDFSKDYVIDPTTGFQKKTLYWTYKGGSDVLSKLYTERGRNYGDYKVEGYKVTADSQPNDFADGETKVELVTSSTPVNAISGTGILVPKFVTASGSFQTPGPRCLYSPGTGKIQLYNDTLSAAETVDVHLLSHYSELTPTVNDYDLNFAPETPLQIIQANPVYSLFNLYWRRSMAEIYSPEAKIMEAYFNLDLIDVLNLKFNDIIYIDSIGISGANWRVLELSEFKIGSGESTKVRLMKVINTEPDCPYSVSNINLDGTVVFVDGSGATSDGSLECCVRVGYDWDGSKCRANKKERGFINSYSQGGNGIGYSGQSLNPNASPYSLTLGASLGISPDVANSIIAGNNIVIPKGNANLLAVGAFQEAIEDIRDVHMLGRNVLARQAGLHLGGGFYRDDITEPQGDGQFGFFAMTGKGGYTDSVTDIELFINGLDSDAGRLSIEDNTAQFIQIEAVVKGMGTGGVMEYGYVQEILLIKKVSLSATVDNQNQIYTYGFSSLAVVVDTTINSRQHRIIIRSPYHYNAITDVRISAAVKYSQVRL